MPKLDLTINLPLLITLAVMLVTLVRYLTRLEDGQKGLKEDVAEVRTDLTSHTQREEKRFDSIGECLHKHDNLFAESQKDRAVLHAKLDALEKSVR